VAIPLARAKPVMAHCTVATSTPKTAPNLARATFTTVASIRKTVTPGSRQSRTSHL
jgi:hypothetical protein